MLDVAYIVYQTLRISAPTVAEAAIGRLTNEKVDSRLASWSRRILDYLDVTLDVRGADKVDWSRSYVVMSNHQSHLDIPILCQVIPGRLRMVAKTELFRYPIWGPAMRAAGMIEIDRSNRKRAIESLRKAGESIRGGINVWIAPEGTRTRNGELGALKKGGFMLALDTHTPILPLVIDGSRKIVPPHSTHPVHGGTVKVTFGAPISVEGVDRTALMEVVESFFRRELERGADAHAT